MTCRLRKNKSAWNKLPYAAIMITSAFTLIYLLWLLTRPNLSSSVSLLWALERETSVTFMPGPTSISVQASSKNSVFLFIKAQPWIPRNTNLWVIIDANICVLGICVQCVWQEEAILSSNMCDVLFIIVVLFFDLFFLSFFDQIFSFVLPQRMVPVVLNNCVSVCIV